MNQEQTIEFIFNWLESRSRGYSVDARDLHDPDVKAELAADLKIMEHAGTIGTYLVEFHKHGDAGGPHTTHIKATSADDAATLLERCFPGMTITKMSRLT